MKYHDPLRPRLSEHKLQYCAEDGSPLATLPQLQVEPLPLTDDGVQRFEVTAMLRTFLDRGPLFTAGWHRSYPLTLADLGELMLDWANDPEGAMVKWLSWERPQGRKAQAPDDDAEPSPQVKIDPAQLLKSLGLVS